MDACETLKPPAVIPTEVGWVALIKRSSDKNHDISPGNDNCSFVRKVIRAQEAGAVAAIVFDDEDEPLKRMAPMPWDPMLQPDIPSVFVSKRSGLQLQKLVELSSAPKSDPIVFFVSGKQLKWISIFTSTTVGVLAIGTVMVLFVFAKYQHGAGFGLPLGEEGDEGAEQGGGGRRRRQKHTLTAEEVETIPKVLHGGSPSRDGAGQDQDLDLEEGERVGGDSSNETCAICLDEYEEDDGLRELPCGHRFHVDCIDEWLTRVNSVCPLCKYDVGRHVKKSREGGQQARQGAAASSSASDGGSEEAEARGGEEEADAETPLLAGGSQEPSSRPGIVGRVRSYFYGPRQAVRIVSVEVEE